MEWLQSIAALFGCGGCLQPEAGVSAGDAAREQLLPHESEERGVEARVPGEQQQPLQGSGRLGPAG